MTPALWPSCRNCLSRKASSFLTSLKRKRATELVEYSHTAKTLLDCQVYMASLRNAEDDEPVQSTIPNYSQMYPSVSARRTLPRMRTKSTGGSGS
jgi:hypothetical protein